MDCLLLDLLIIYIGLPPLVLEKWYLVYVWDYIMVANQYAIYASTHLHQYVRDGILSLWSLVEYSKFWKPLMHFIACHCTDSRTNQWSLLTGVALGIPNSNLGWIRPFRNLVITGGDTLQNVLFFIPTFFVGFEYNRLCVWIIFELIIYQDTQVFFAVAV